MSERPLHLNAFLMSTGHHEAAWRLPESDPFAATQLEHYAHLARTAERGTFDSLFLADSPTLTADVGQRPAGVLEPTILLTALAAATSRIGLIATASTTYEQPYNLARRFSALDHISGGRAGWNVVTNATAGAARNFNLDELPTHQLRYQRAREFVDVTQKLWDSWEDQAEVGDKDGEWADAEKVHAIHHRGEFFSVEGPLNAPRSPQGRPLLVQAGSSEDGKDLAARYAEAVFTAQQTLQEGKDFYADLKQRAAEHGRDPEQVKILPGIVPVIAATEAEARRKEAALTDRIVHGYALRTLSSTLGVELGEQDLDRKLAADELPGEERIESAKSRYALVADLALREDLTVREIIQRLGGGRGHRTFTGTPEQVADTIEHWFTAGAADGFNVMPAVLPSGLEDFVDLVVPILRERGLFRSEYGGSTLREHYGLPRPASQFAAQDGASVPGGAHDGTAHDGAAEDGAAQDGAAVPS